MAVGYFASPIGLLEVRGDRDEVTSIRFVVRAEEAADTAADAVHICLRQLEEYFQGKRTAFQVPLKRTGTPFQRQVWSRGEAVPFGRTAVYRDIAASLGRAGAVRAVGSANGQNRFAIVIPCHRIIGSDGSLRGYAWELWRKEWLLDHERRVTGSFLS